MNNAKSYYPFWILFLLWNICSSAFAQTKLHPYSFFLKTEAGYETNILESYLTSKDDNTLYIWGGFRYDHYSRKNRFHLNLLSNISLYSDYSSENKNSNNITLFYRRNFSQILSLETDINLFHKSWYNIADYHYFNGCGSALLGMQFQRMSVRVGPQLRRNRYRINPNYDSDVSGFVLKASYPVRPAFSLHVDTQYDFIDYAQRSVFQRAEFGDSSKMQDDRIFLLNAGVEYHKDLIAGVAFQLIRLSSNSFLSEYWGYSLQAYATKRWHQTILQLAVQLFLKDYSKELIAHLVDYYPDPEQNIQNQILFGWERPLRKGLSATGKAAMMRNESRYSGVYYDKWYISAGIQYRFE